MTGIITGNIANFNEQIKMVLENQVKSGQLIITSDNIDEKQLTISISAIIANFVDIYHLVKDGVLYMYIFHNLKKGKKNLDARDKNLMQQKEQYKELIINYKDAGVYNIVVAFKGVANISKTLKKKKLEMIKRIDDSHTLYKFMNKYFFMIDGNGALFYYPDSIEIKSIKSWLATLDNKNILESILDDTNYRIILDKYMLLNKFIAIECHLDITAYELCDVIGYNLESEKSNQSQPEYTNTSNTNVITEIGTSYSSLGYILSWLNPLSYYTSNISSSNYINQENKNIAILNIDNITKDKQNSNYFLDMSSQNYDLIKMQDNQIKILKAQKIEIPAFITDITIDNVDNIIITSRIDNQPITIKYNKYMVGMHLV
jgi:hypothetical protein